MDKTPEITPLSVGDLDVVIDGVDWAFFSNAAEVDGKLHLQFKPTASYNFYYTKEYLALLNSDGDEIPLYYFDIEKLHSITIIGEEYLFD